MGSTKKIASVILDHYNEKMDHYFDYLVPEAYQPSIQPGMRILVPFGKGNKTWKRMSWSFGRRKIRQKN